MPEPTGLLVVAGMHRSGTSAVAALTESLGSSLGRPERLLGPSKENERGYFENSDIVRLNDDLLAYHGGNWLDPPQLPEGWARHQDLKPFRDRAARILRDDFDENEPAWTIKDPRLALTLPFWETVHPIAHVLHVLRDPREVADSLAVRGVQPWYAHNCWTRYVQSLCAAAPSQIIVPYHEVVEHPERVAVRLATECGLSFSDDIVLPIESRLRHNHAGGERTPLSEVERVSSQLFNDVLAGGATGVPSKEMRTLPAPTGSPSALAKERNAIGSSGTARAAIVTAFSSTPSLTEAARHAQEAAALLAEAQRHRSGLTAEVSQLSDEVSGLKAEVSGLKVEASELEAHNAGLHAELEVARRGANHAKSLEARRSVRCVLRLTEFAKPLFGAWRLVKVWTVDPRQAKSLVRRRFRDVRSRRAPQPALLDLASDQQTRRLDFAKFEQANSTTVVVPVYGSAAAVRQCLENVLAHSAGLRVVVVDDASPDQDTTDLLASYKDSGQIEILRNETNLGFVGTANRGIEAAGRADVVLLNSDAFVSPGWHLRLKAAAYSSGEIGTATPLSNNAGAFSAPSPGTNEYPDVSLWSIAAAVVDHSEWLLPRVPTGNGFCLYLKRAFVDEVGLFDDEFGRGYGEENDLCMRGDRVGWRHVIDDSTVVLHGLGTSFGAERDELMARNRKVLDRRYPEYTERVRAAFSGPEVLAARANVGHAFESLRNVEPKPRVLFVMHGFGGGTKLTNIDLMVEVSAHYEPLLLTSDGENLVLARLGAGDDPFELEEVQRSTLATPLRPGPDRNAEYLDVVFDLLIKFRIDLVHVRQFVHHHQSLVDVVTALSIPYVLSLHDYFAVCPTIQLLDNQMTYCGGACTAGNGTCAVDVAWLSGLPHLKHGYVHEWRDMYRGALGHADYLVTTSQQAREVFYRAFPETQSKPFQVIEHGRDLEQRELACRPTSDGKIRILVPGNINEQKGGNIIRELCRLDQKQQRLEFFFLGNVKSTLRGLGTELGPYKREDFASIVETVSPSFCAILSIWAETYCHTLSESWACGVPVLGFDIGAVGERIREHGGGWVFEVGTSAAVLYEEILRLANETDEFDGAVATASVANLRSAADMAGNYLSIYRELLPAHHG